jgi:hypothetical protein
MKNLKMLGLLAVAAAALMALLGASTASATVLCKNNLKTSSCSEPYAAETFLHGVLEKNAIFENAAGETLGSCTQSTFQMRVETAGGSGATVSGPIPSFTWGIKGEGCNQTTETLRSGRLEIHHINNTDDGTVTAFNTEVTLLVFGGVDCIYGAGAGIHFGTLTGGAPATLDVNAVLNEQEPKKFLCPDDIRLTGGYEITSPTPLYVIAS